MSHEGKMRRGRKFLHLDGTLQPNFQADVDYYKEHSKVEEVEVKKGRPKKED